MAHGSATTQGQLNRHKVLQYDEDETVKEVVLDNGDAVPKQLQVPSKYWRVEGMAATFLSQNVFNLVELAAASEANLKHSLMRRGQTEYAQRIMPDMLEMMTGLQRRHVLTGGMRILSRFLEDIGSRNIARGRRCLSVQLPPDWSTAGLYYINVSGQSVVIEHRFTRKKAGGSGRGSAARVDQAGEPVHRREFQRDLGSAPLARG